MKFEDWVTEQLAQKNGMSRRRFLEEFSEQCGVSYMTLAPLDKGSRMGLYEKAKAVSRATNWKVTIPELCGDKDITPEIQAQFNALATVLS